MISSDDTASLRDALTHAIYRNHAHRPDACAHCALISKLHERVRGERWPLEARLRPAMDAIGYELISIRCPTQDSISVCYRRRSGGEYGVAGAVTLSDGGAADDELYTRVLSKFELKSK